MNFNDRMAALPGLIADKLEYPAATLKRTVTARSEDDRAAGRRGSIITETITGRGLFGQRRVRLADGTLKIEAVASLIVPKAPRNGDKLTIGTRTLTVEIVEEENPTGNAHGIEYTVTLS